jgi:hypothetical protein
MILDFHLGVDYDEMNRIYIAGGKDGVADYIDSLVANYVETHKKGLQISRLRKIEGFDAVIDPTAEYRIAMRVGCLVNDDGTVDLGGKNHFDYHFWVQLNNGQWAQKFPLDPSEVVPCSGPGVSPGKYPWNAAISWSREKDHDFDDSKVLYYAVTKDTDAFTKHREQ